MILQWIIIAALVVISLIMLLQRLLPLTVRIKLAHYLQGRVSDRIRIWLVGHAACGQCGPKV